MGTCTRPASEGETCNPESFIPCAYIDNYCDTTTLVCTPGIAVGGTCDPATRCVPYAFCDNGTCVQHALQGEACDAQGPRDCLGELDCVNGICVAPAPEEVCTLTPAQ